jgi:hypothetical protein
MMKKKTDRFDLLCLTATDILHEYHYIRLVQLPVRVSSNCQLHAAEYFVECQNDRGSKQIRNGFGILEYFVVQSLSS